MKRFRPSAASPHAVRASGDRWLFGYADIVTLLFACFASLYATSLAPAASEPVMAQPPAPRVEPEIAVPSAPDPSDLERTLASRLETPESIPGLEITSNARGVVISLPEAGSFPPGRAELSPAARRAILDLARDLRDVPYGVRVEGHTDDVPIRTAEFESNWALSTSRATRVVRLLVEEGQLDPARLAAAGYAEYRPRLPNTTAETRARNRRVDIVVFEMAHDATGPRAEALP